MTTLAQRYEAARLAQEAADFLNDFANNDVTRAAWRLADADDLLREILTAEGYAVLADDGEPFCRVCGCTEEDGCPGGCHWVDPCPGLYWLCSSCQPKEAASADGRHARAAAENEAPL